MVATAGAAIHQASRASRRSAPRGSADGNRASAESDAVEQLLHLRRRAGERSPRLRLAAQRPMELDLEYLGELGVDRGDGSGHRGLDDLARLGRRYLQRVRER